MPEQQEPQKEQRQPRRPLAAAPSARRQVIGSMLRGYREAHGYKLEEAALILECDRSKIFPRRDRRARHPAQGAPRAAHRVRSSLARTIRWALSHGVRPELARLPITPEQVAEEYAKRSTARERT